MIRIILAYKNFAANQNISHIGLGVAALNTQKVLQQLGYEVEVWPILDANNLRQRLNLDRSGLKPGEAPVTHVVVSAPWIAASSWLSLTSLFPKIQFAECCHSNVGFLQADTQGTKNFVDGLNVEHSVANFKMAGNSLRFVKWVIQGIGDACAYLPNLYYLGQTVAPRPLFHAGVLKIGAFGATRPLKNLLSAVAAAMEIAYQMKVQTEVHVSSGRMEGGGSIFSAATQLVKASPFVKIVADPWAPWPDFRKVVGSMNLLLQPSYTESFNMVTADGIAMGVPSVVGEAIDWTPPHWEADVDDVNDIARVGRSLLADPHAAQEGLTALQSYIKTGTRAWTDYLTGVNFGIG